MKLDHFISLGDLLLQIIKMPKHFVLVELILQVGFLIKSNLSLTWFEAPQAFFKMCEHFCSIIAQFLS